MVQENKTIESVQEDLEDLINSATASGPRWHDVNPEISTEAIEYRREKTATWLAYWIMGIFLIMVLAGIGIQECFSCKMPNYAQDFIQKVIPVVASLLGMVFGFYFAKERL